ncbi:organic cation transporter protein [Pieris rapae]|uniref:organic cation transporter protein n=1 Tax=Pieris rapae TaxID=64459 RepID=UPI001E27AC03|nr:organic cation transporter protein [Pieris rapae]
MEEHHTDGVEALLTALGPFGWWQRGAVLLLLLPNLLAPMYSLNYVFVADRVPFRCLVPECEEAHSARFSNATAARLVQSDACRRPAPRRPGFRTCDPTNFDADHSVPCEQILYENRDTVFAEFDLACREWRRTLIGTVRNAALPLALLLTGYVSDGWGRRTAFCVFGAFAGVLGLVKSFAPNYNSYIALEFLEAALGYGFNSAAYVIMVEIARPSLRAVFACATGVAYGLGGILFAETARRIPQWRSLLRVVYSPALVLPAYWLLLDESVRWLHATGRADEAAAVVRKAARWNKVVIDESFINESLTSSGKTGGTNVWIAIGQVVRSRALVLRLLACCSCWIMAAFIYYGLTINSIALAGNKYTNFALNMAMEVAASLLIMMALERIGRKITISVAFSLCGFAAVLPFFIGPGMTQRVMHFVGKLAITFAFNSLYVFTAELFPTDARSSSLAAASLVGRIGSVLAPQTPLLSANAQAAAYGGAAAVGALAAALMPETRRTPLPQRARDAEELRCYPPPPVPMRPPLRSVAPQAPPGPALTRIMCPSI